jgi:hypothetical protein
MPPKPDLVLAFYKETNTTYEHLLSFALTDVDLHRPCGILYNIMDYINKTWVNPIQWPNPSTLDDGFADSLEDLLFMIVAKFKKGPQKIWLSKVKFETKGFEDLEIEKQSLEKQRSIIGKCLFLKKQDMTNHSCVVFFNKEDKLVTIKYYERIFIENKAKKLIPVNKKIGNYKNIENYLKSGRVYGDDGDNGLL